MDLAKRETLWALFLGLTMALVACSVGDTTAKYLSAGCLGIVALTVAIVVRDVRRVCLLLIVTALPLVSVGRPYGLSILFPWLKGGSGGFSVDALFVFLLFAYVTWALEGVSRRGSQGPVRLIPELVPLLFLVMAAFNSIGGAESASTTFYGVLKLVQHALLFFYIAATVRDTKDFRLVTAALGLVALGEGGITMLQLLSGGTFQLALFRPTGTEAVIDVFTGEGPARFIGTFSHPNTLARWLMLTTPVLFAVAVRVRRPVWLWRLAAAAVAAAAYASGLTVSRLLLLCLPVAMGTAFFLVRDHGGASATASRVAKVAPLLLVAPLVLAAPSFYERLTAEAHRGAAVDHFHTMPLAIWIASENPWQGVGLSAYRDNLKRLPDRGGELASRIDDYIVANSPPHHPWLRRAAVHSIYLLILAETGIVGCVAYIVFLVGLIFTGFRTASRIRDPLLCALAGGSTASLAGFAIFSAFETGALLKMPEFWLIAGLLVAAVRAPDACVAAGGASADAR